MQLRSFGRCIHWILFCFFILGSNTVSGEVIFTAPPLHNEETSKQLYGPLIRYLELIIGETVVFEYPADWREYSKNMREDHYDIVFDAPHFTSWRMKNIQHEPVARLAGNLNYVVVTNRDEEYINTIKDLVATKICSLASPNLSTMTVYQLFQNPVYMPQIKEISGEFNDVYQALKDGHCKAAVLRSVDFERLVEEERNSLKIIAKSDSMPERTITVSKRLHNKKRILTMMLTSVEGSRAGSNIFRQYGKKQQEFVPAKQAEYKDLDDLLSHVVWGW